MHPFRSEMYFRARPLSGARPFFRMELLHCSGVFDRPLGTPPRFSRQDEWFPMKIAQIAPLIESVPPRFYGGTERVVSYLTEELVAQGHEVTLFASGDSITAANLVPCCTQALRLDTAVSDVVPYYMLMLDKVRSQAAQFDVLHFHIDHFQFPIFRHLPIPSLTTLHGRQDHRDCLPFYAGFSDMPLISISDAQRAPLPHANFVKTSHHGLPQDLHEANYRPNGGYLAFIGRISPEKGPADAIRIAQSLGIPLKIAAKVDKVDESYFREVVQPLLSTQGVEFIGEINEKDKGPRYAGSRLSSPGGPDGLFNCDTRYLSHFDC
jgi:glycosyltransferase involved in cell wall biosynthesis